jgi:hypothetical protein
VIVRQETHETASAFMASDAGLEIGSTGRGGDFTWDDVTPFDATELGLKGRNDSLEGMLADMLTMLNIEAVDHGCLLFAAYSAAPY